MAGLLVVATVGTVRVELLLVAAAALVAWLAWSLVPAATGNADGMRGRGGEREGDEAWMARSWTVGTVRNGCATCTATLALRWKWTAGQMALSSSRADESAVSAAGRLSDDGSLSHSADSSASLPTASEWC